MIARTGILILLILLALLLTACRTQITPPAGTSSLVIECLVAYRTGVSADHELEETFTLSEEATTLDRTFGELIFHSQYWPGNQAPFEHALQIRVTTADGDHELVSQLFQFLQDEPVRNQFSGDHGFSGLSYVYHPANGSELQYSCRIK
jgi:hypothetical protein